MDTGRTDWIKAKRAIALRLASGECGGSYGEAVIILCASISALAAGIWPGRGKDRARFVEVLKEFAPPYLNTVRISIPLLVGSLRKQRRIAEMEILRNAFVDYCSSLVLTGDNVDKSEAEIMVECPSLNSKEIRHCSYANLLYEELRSGYAHEYSPGDRADSQPMTSSQTTPVSYVNWLNDPDRHIHFHVEWLGNVVTAVAEAVGRVNGALPRKDPAKWWIHA